MMRIRFGMLGIALLLLRAFCSAGTPVQPPSKHGNPVLARKGYVVAAHTVLVTPEVGGRVVKLHCDEGQEVKRGDVLAEIDATPHELAYRQTLGQVAIARARLEEDTAGSASKHRLALRKGELAVAEAQRDLARYRVEQAQVRAPMDGVILSRKVEEGNFVDRWPI